MTLTLKNPKVARLVAIASNMPRPKTHRETIRVEATPAEVFDLIHDYGRRLEWDPFLRRAELLDANHAGVGVRARCVAKWTSGGAGMDVQYLSFDRPRVAAIEMVRGPWPLRTFVASLKQDPLDSGAATLVTYSFHFTSALPWLTWPVFNRFFARETRGRLRALQRFFAKRQSETASL